MEKTTIYQFEEAHLLTSKSLNPFVNLVTFWHIVYVVHMFMTKKVKDHFIQQAIYESHLFFDEYHSFSQGPALLHANHKDNVVPAMLHQ